MALVAIAVSVGASRAAFPTLPPVAHTGGFGEPSCRVCHSDAGLNEQPGRLALAGVPSAYEPGTDYLITVTLSRPDLARGGFELAARVAEGASAGRQAGALGATDARVNITDTTHAAYGLVSYARHIGDTSPPRDSVRWTLKWTAPARLAGAVVFDVAANAANDDESPLGDYVYTTRVTTRPR